ncbi:ATPase inhibitor, mitochondrial, partial [Pseudocercospora fuligena]
SIIQIITFEHTSTRVQHSRSYCRQKINHEQDTQNLATMSRLTKPISLLLLRPHLIITSKRFNPLSIKRCFAEGDTGSPRLHGDSWTKREKATEDLYIKGREKNIMMLLKEKIAAQEAVLEKDRAILSAMEDQYGHLVEGTYDTAGQILASGKEGAGRMV